MAADAYSLVDALVIDAITRFPGVQRLIAEELIQTWRDDVQILGRAENVPYPRLRIDPAPSETRIGWGNAADLIERRYVVWYGTASLDRSVNNRIEMAVTAALMRLCLNLDPLGNALQLSAAPLEIQSAAIDATDPYLEPIGGTPEEFTNSLRVTVRATALRSAYIAAAEAVEAV